MNYLPLINGLKLYVCGEKSLNSIVQTVWILCSIRKELGIEKCAVLTMKR